EHTKTYQSMYDHQLALDMSKKQGLGLAEMMVKQLRRPDSTEPGTAEAVADAVPLAFDPQQRVPRARQMPAPDSLASGTQVQPGAAAPRDWQPASREDFVRALWPHAQRTAQALGTRPEALVAQAALETGWGRNMIRTADGQNSFNLFGIKADTQWQGERAVSETVEFRDGLMRRERAAFRAYPSLADSFADYADFLKSRPRYREALQAGGDAPSFVRALSQAGYATDPGYADKIGEIMNSKPLRELAPAVREDAGEPTS
ncbi:MAG TPA: flagellar assembly peptidoglycan hydrolase FlgJ, partial [Gammaproteobacteria bacterium]|nr:flagellar assembly peptidoglycan hydrolase FlgJ [Gammaproteobacteria bacterium]